MSQEFQSFRTEPLAAAGTQGHNDGQGDVPHPDPIGTDQRLRHLIDTIPGVVFMFRRAPDGQLSFPFLSHTFRELFGLEPAEVEFDFGRVLELAHPDDLQVVKDAIAESARSMTPYRVESRLCRPGRPQQWLDIQSAPEPQSDGSILWYGVMLDITDRKRAEQAVLKHERDFYTLAESSPDSIMRYDIEGRIRYLNSKLEHDLGKTLAELDGKLSCEVWPDGRFAAIEAGMWRAILHGEANTVVVPVAFESTDVLHHHIRIFPERDESGRIVGALAFGGDGTALHHLQRAVAAHEQEFRALVEHSTDTIARFDRECRRTYVNPALQLSYGAEGNALLGATPSEFPGGEWGQRYEAAIAQVLAGGGSADFNSSRREASGKIIHRLVRLTPEVDLNGVIVSVLTIGRDITELMEQREKIHNLAFFDFVTGLANRALFTDRLEQSIVEARWHGTRLGVIVLDLDRFKAVNDTLGHSVGDTLLREAGARLSRSVRAYDTVARLGGDEYALLLPEIRDASCLSTVADKVLKAFASPFPLDGREVFVGASIGIAVFPDDDLDADGLLKFADLAMYAAKRAGGHCFRYYSAELTERARERLRLETGLRHAVERGELALHFQPQVTIADGRVISSEALLRWHSQELGLVMPDQFIGIAEDTGLIVEIGEWVLHEACRAACDWHAFGLPHKVAVNLSPRQFEDPDLDKRIATTLIQTGCRPEWIELEITERLLVGNIDRVRTTLETLREQGFSIAIDDFGTGYSSLSYLTELPIDVLKIDRVFVKDVLSSASKRELVRTIIAMANSLSMKLVAEGVETLAQADFLAASGCDVGQGYLFGRPIPRAQLEETLASSGPSSRR